jgi:hypothetical protein
MNEHPIPNVEPECWTLEDGQLYYIREEERYRVIEMTIVANGTRDLCVAITPNGSPAIMKISEAEKDKIILTPKNDLCQMELNKPLHGKSNQIIFEITPETKHMLDVVFKHGKAEMRKKGKNFDMCSGEDYYER